MIRWILKRLGYRIEYRSTWGTHAFRYSSLDMQAARPIHPDMSVAPPWAKRHIVREGEG